MRIKYVCSGQMSMLFEERLLVSMSAGVRTLQHLLKINLLFWINFVSHTEEIKTVQRESCRTFLPFLIDFNPLFGQFSLFRSGNRNFRNSKK